MEATKIVVNILSIVAAIMVAEWLSRRIWGADL